MTTVITSVSVKLFSWRKVTNYFFFINNQSDFTYDYSATSLLLHNLMKQQLYTINTYLFQSQSLIKLQFVQWHLLTNAYAYQLVVYNNITGNIIHEWQRKAVYLQVVFCTLDVFCNLLLNYNEKAVFQKHV